MYRVRQAARPSRTKDAGVEKEGLRPNRSARLPPTSSAGETHGIGVDDPLQFARGGMQNANNVATQR